VHDCEIRHANYIANWTDLKVPKGLVVHVPHSSIVIPPEVRAQFVVSDTDLANEASESADLWREWLAETDWPEATRIIAKASRAVIGVERYPDDA
jgi:N-formylglutamate deformylase